jgi:uncharacterized peroxidase-related enzyme
MQETFTLDVLRWQPWLRPVQLDEADEAQIKALTAAGAITRDSPYFRTLAHAPGLLAARMALYNDIVYGREGLPRAEREFSMFAVSRVNACVYCASIHGRRYVELTKDSATIEALLASEDTTSLPPRLRAIFDFARAITLAPTTVGLETRASLGDAGFSEAEILDLLHATSMFSWANTLMLTLGQPEPASHGA